MSPEQNNKDVTDLGERTNRYYHSPVRWSTYPEGVILACRGSKDRYDYNTETKCGSVKDWYASPNFKNKKMIPNINRCGRLKCNMDGLYLSSKKAKKSALRILAYSRLSNLNKIRFISFDFQFSQDASRLWDSENGEYKESKKDFESRKKKLKVFDFKEGESFRTWLKRVEKKITRDALTAGFQGFALIFHSCRLKTIKGVEYRVWDPHFHLIGSGYLLQGDEFFRRFGYLYVPQKSIDKKDMVQVRDLAGRLSYRINHCAFYESNIGHASHCVKYYGEMSYRKLKILEEKKIRDPVLDEEGNPLVRVRINREKIKSDLPHSIKRRIALIEYWIALYCSGKVSCVEWKGKIYDTGYYPSDWDNELAMLKNLRYEEGLEIDDLDPGDIEVLKNKQGDPIKLYSVEELKRFYNPRLGKYCVVSSYEFEKNKVPRFEELDSSFKNALDAKRVLGCWEIFLKKVNDRDPDRGLEYVNDYLEVL